MTSLYQCPYSRDLFSVFLGKCNRDPRSVDSTFTGLTILNPFRALARLAAAQDCFLCAGPSIKPVCAGCDDDLPRPPVWHCPTCALASAGCAVCGRCLSAAPAYDATVAGLVYAWPATRLVQAFKYERALGLAATLAGYLGDAIDDRRAARPDLVIAIPLAPERMHERGYNQSREIARVLARRHGFVLDGALALRTRHTPAQADLPWRERARNIRGAFAVNRRLDGLSIAVIDDVMTTGATLNEMATTLKASGAARVTNWVAARTLPHVESGLAG